MNRQRTVLWRGLQAFSADYCQIGQADDGWAIAGLMLLPMNGRPARLQYRVDCDSDWATRAVEVTLDRAGAEHRLKLTVASPTWFVNGTARGDLVSCVDVDLSGSPATNTLPIRRLNLARGEAREIVAAWVRFPDLVVEPLGQRYTRLDDQHYRYESIVDGVRVFTADLMVDDLGLVTHYPDGWTSVVAG